jgi:hypothetical protein
MSDERNPSASEIQVMLEQLPEDAATLELWADAVAIIRKLARKQRAARKAAESEIDGNENNQNAA